MYGSGAPRILTAQEFHLYIKSVSTQRPGVEVGGVGGGEGRDNGRGAGGQRT